MTSQQIEYFLAVAKHMNFTKAAEELYVTQPAVSRQIAALEEGLGVSLFVRTNNQIELSPEGQIYFDTFSKMESLYQDAEAKVKQLQEEKKEHLTVGFLAGWDMSKFLTPIMRNLPQKNLNIELNIESRSFRELFQFLSSGDLDIIITLDGAVKNKKEYMVQPLTEISRILVYSKTIYKPGKKKKTPKDFKDETFWVVGDEEVPGAIQLVKSYCQPYGFDPRCKTAPNTESCIASLHNGGVAVLDTWMRDMNNEEYGYLTLNSNHVVSMFWLRSNQKKAIPDFVDIAVKALHKD